MSAPSSVESAWGFSHKEWSHYYAFYHEIVPEGELLAGSRAREFFLLSNLSPSTLSHIWRLSDYDQDGQLNEAEFGLALNFCQLALDGLQPPATSLPGDLQLLLEQATNPGKHVPQMKQNQLEKCVSVFLSFMENDGGQAYLAGEAARYLLTNSQLPKAALFHIWKLSDRDEDGRLSFKEFVLAMHLIFISKLSQPLPISLDPAKVLPQEFGAMEKKITLLVAQKPQCSNRGNTRPSIPAFVQPINNPCISQVFKEIPTDKFLKGKFETFVGNPFQSETNHEDQQMNGSHSYSSQDELSARLSDDTSDSCDVSKLSSASQHSSVKSLVEEKDKPAIRQVEPIDVQEVATEPGYSSTHQGEELDDEDVELNPVEKKEMEEELEKISKVSQDYLQKNGGADTPTSVTTATTGANISGGVVDKFTKDPSMQSASVKGLSSTISEITPEPKNRDNAAESIKATEKSEPQTKSQPQVKPQTQTQAQPEAKPEPRKENGGIDLSFLDDLEAQVMDVLDDTNTFDPTKVAPPPEPKKLSPPPPPSAAAVHKRNSSSDDTDSVFTPMSPSKSKTLPHRRVFNTSNGASSPFEIRTRKSSDSTSDSSSSPYRRNTMGVSPSRKKLNSNSNRASLILDDLDDIFSNELAQIDGLMDATKNKQEERKRRIEKEREDLKNAESKVTQVNTKEPKLTSLEEVARRREKESAQMQQDWEKEFEEKAKKAYDEQMNNQLQLLDDETIHDLESQFQELIEHEAHLMKDARVIRAQRMKEMEEERERMREEMRGKNEVTVEEWIKLMEESKLKKMTPEEREKYEERKKAWLEQRRKKEEERKRIEEEKLRKNREMIEKEYERQRRIEAEIETNRLTKDQLSDLEQEQVKREAEERKMRMEQAKQKKEELKQQEMENSKPKARSTIAARWEEQVKGRNGKDFHSTVLSTSHKSPGHREAERLAKRFGNL